MNSDSETTRNWAPIVGRWSIESATEGVNYLGPQSDHVRPFGICVTDTALTDGRINVKCFYGSSPEGPPPDRSGTVLLGYRSPTEHYVMIGLGGWHSAYSIGEYDPSSGWRALARAGADENLSPGQQHDIQVTLTGQRILLAVNGVRVLEHVLEKPLTGGQVGLWAFGDGPVHFSHFSIKSRPGKLFVVMPLTEPYQRLHEQVITKVAGEKQFGLEAFHAGEMCGPGVILHDIEQSIVDAKVVIAEITPATESAFNANVFYEIGYAHALGKPTILLAERERVKQLPFDISGYRVLFYDNTIAGKEQVEEGLRKHLEAILGNPSRNGA
jgi:hypothetical protein